jgi:hypothetical protein
VSVHVGEKLETEFSPSDALHPTQGASAVLKLVAQPPLQLLADRSSLAIFLNTGLDAADDVSAFRDARRAIPWLAVCLARCGLATGFGASTVMPGSEAAEPVAVCAATAPLGHSRAVDRIATDSAVKIDDNLMTLSQIRDGNIIPTSACYHEAQIGLAALKKYLPTTCRRRGGRMRTSATI